MICLLMACCTAAVVGPVVVLLLLFTIDFTYICATIVADTIYITGNLPADMSWRIVSTVGALQCVQTVGAECTFEYLTPVLFR